MTTVNSSTLADLGLVTQKAGEKGKQQLGQDDFLKLMTTQMKFQDPFKPMDSSPFLGQIAQFSTVSGIEKLNASFSSLTSSLQSDQTLQAAQLVGHGVLVPADEGYLFQDEGLGGAVDLPASGQAIVEIRDAGGQVVRTLDLGTQAAGLAYFNWDGLDAAGNQLPAGRYGISARVLQGNNTQAASTYAMGLVNSVSVDSSGLNLNLYGMNPAAFGTVKQIF